LDWLTAPPPNERLDMNWPIALWFWLKMKPARPGLAPIVAIASWKLEKRRTGRIDRKLVPYDPVHR
jgi:hypothetical protein